MEGSGSNGFDLSKMSTAEKLLAGGSILFLIVSFFPWQSFGGELDELGELIGVDVDTNFNMWQGSGSWAGWIAGLLAIVLIVVAVLSMTGSMANMNMGTMSTDQLVGYLGLGVAGFGLLKFLLVLTNEVSWGAFLGLLLLVAIGWGAWQKVQEGGGFQMGGGATGGSGGAMGGPPPPSGPPPSAPPPTEPPGGAPLSVPSDV
jgi:hypothetical protein